MLLSSLPSCLATGLRLLLLSLCLPAITTMAGEDFEIPSLTAKKALQDNSVDAIVSSSDGRFLMARDGDQGFVWDQETRKLVSELNLEKFDRVFLGSHGFLGTVELADEFKRDVEADEYRIELLSPAAVDPIPLVSHIAVSRIDFCSLSPSGDKLLYVSRNWRDEHETIHVMDLKSGKLLRRFVAPDDFDEFAWTHQEASLILAADSELQLFKLHGVSNELVFEPDHVSNLQSSRISGIVVTERQEVLVVHDDYKLRIYTLRDNALELRSTIDLEGMYARHISYDQTQRVATLYSAYGDADSFAYVDIDSESVTLKVSVSARKFFEAGKRNEYVALVDGCLRSYTLDSCTTTVNPIAKTPDPPGRRSSYYGVIGFDKSSGSLVRASNGGFSRWQIKNSSIQTIGNHVLDSFELEDDEFLSFSASLGYLARSSNSLYQCTWDQATNSAKTSLLLRFPSQPSSFSGNTQSLIRFRDKAKDRYRLALLDDNGKFQKIIDPPEGWDDASVSPDGSLCAVSDSRTISVLDASGNEKFSKDCQVGANMPPQFSFDQRVVVFGPSQINIRSGAVELAYPFEDITTTTVSPTNALTAYGHSNGAVFLFNQTTKQIIACLGIMDSEVSCLAFHPNGKTLAALDEYGAMAVWDVGIFDAPSEGNPIPVPVDELELPWSFQTAGISVSITSDSNAPRAAVSAALRAALREIEGR